MRRKEALRTHERALKKALAEEQAREKNLQNKQNKKEETIKILNRDGSVKTELKPLT